MINTAQLVRKGKSAAGEGMRDYIHADYIPAKYIIANKW
jgi:hypothetical protein